MCSLVIPSPNLVWICSLASTDASNLSMLPGRHRGILEKGQNVSSMLWWIFHGFGVRNTLRQNRSFQALKVGFSMYNTGMFSFSSVSTFP